MPGVPVERILELGREDDPAMFNMAHMGLRLGQRANGVSVLHGAVSREMFCELWPGFDEDEVPISSVTNGVHAPTWMAREILEIADARSPTAIVVQGGGWDGDRQGRATRELLDVRGRCACGWSRRSAGGCARPASSAA